MGNDKAEKLSVRDDEPRDNEVIASTDLGYGEINDNADQLQRRLNNRQIQLIAIGGSIGTALFVSIGKALWEGGAGSLFIAYTLYSLVIANVNNCMAEMGVMFPVSGGFVRCAGHWVDDAFGFMAGWNFYLYEALLIPFEITALNVVLSFWSKNIPPEAICAACIILYAIINFLAVRAYGEAEFWLSGGKFFLIVILFLFTFFTMVGGNPQHDAYGFVNWQRPGAFLEFLSTGSLGRFEGFLACVWSAAFCIVGPEYISMVAAEAKRPRIYIKTAFKTVYWRFGIFFIMGALCTGIVVSPRDKQLNDIYANDGSTGTAAASPYVIAMTNLGVQGLPHLVNALLVTSIFSAGNTYTYCATRTLYGLSLEGRAPRVFQKCTKNGVPWVCFCLTICFPFLSFLSVSSNAVVVLNWLVDLVTAAGIIDYIVMTTTYLCFYNACKVQGMDRSTFPYTGRFQPYSAWIGLTFTILTCIFYGYSTFRPANSASVPTFFQFYTMLIVDPILYFGWKLWHRTKVIPAEKRDLVWERPIIDAYEDSFTSPPVGFWTEVVQMFGLRRKSKDNVRTFSVSA